MTFARFFLGSILLLLPLFLLGQKPGLVFHQLSTKDGLSENTVRTIIEDRKGFMWFGTEDGVNRFDGYEFKIFRHDINDPYSITNNNTKNFFIDKQGRTWICTIDGLNIYDDKLERFDNYRSNKYKALKSLRGHLEMMTQDALGNYWIVSSSEGIFRITDLQKPAEKFHEFFSDNSAVFTCMGIFDNDNLYVGTIDGLLKFHLPTKKFTDLRSMYGRGYHINRIYIDNEKNTWLATTHGLKIIKRDGSVKEYLPIPGDNTSLIAPNVVDIIPYKNNTYLLAVDGGGIDFFNYSTEKFYHYTYDNESQLSGNNLTALYKDSKGDLWAGTFLNGVNYSNSTTNLFVLVKNSPGSEEAIRKGIISSFHKDKPGNFWIATDGGGLYKKEINGKLKNYSNNNTPGSLPNNAVISIAEDPEGTLYFTTYGGGLAEYNPKDDNFITHLPDLADSSSISNDKLKDAIIYNNQLWVCGYGKGISVLTDKKNRKWKHYRDDRIRKTSIPTDWVQCFYEDREGVLWLATFNGLSRYIAEKDQFKNYFLGNDDHSQGRNFLIDIVEDHFGNMWLATNGEGLILFNRKDGTHKVFTYKNGLTDNNLKSIIEDNYGNLWIATNKGITKLHIPTMKFKSYTFKDGVPPCAFFLNSKLLDEDGLIYFGTNNGYLVINPALTIPNNKIPPVVLTKLKIFNEPILTGRTGSPLRSSITETDSIRLSYNQNSITIEFAALNFNNTQNNKYAYMLEGFDDEWVLASQRSATYTNLNPGNYIFKVKAANNDNIWNNHGTALSIVITPPYYKTWWFNTLAVISIVAFLYILYDMRLKNIRRKNHLLEETVRKRTQELKDANEQLEAFVYKASHDIKGPLKSIIGLTTIGQKDVKDESAKNYFEHILRSTRKLDNLLMDLLEITKVKQATIQLEKINFKELITEVLVGFENLPEYKQMKFSINIKESGNFFSDKKLLYFLIQNLIENPIKYRDPQKAENILDIEIKVVNTNAELIFRDNGIGIPEEHLNRVFDMFFKVNDSSNGTGLGLYIVKTTLEKLHGSVQVKSTLGEGTTMIVKL